MFKSKYRIVKRPGASLYTHGVEKRYLGFIWITVDIFMGVNSARTYIEDCKNKVIEEH